MGTSRHNTDSAPLSDLDAPRTWTIVVAAGTGSRFGGAVPKQFVEIDGRRIVDWSIATAASVADGVVVVLPAGFTALPPSGPGCVVAVEGGDSRSDSVRRGLAAVPTDAAVVLVHDAARPLASAELFERVIAAVKTGADAVVPTVPVIDTLRTVDGDAVDRDQLVAVQTPQGFRTSVLRAAHEGDPTATDDATLVVAIGGNVVTVPGERWNIKVTDPRDDLVAEALLANDAADHRAEHP